MKTTNDAHGELTYKNFKISYQVISIKVWYSAKAELWLDDAMMKALELEDIYQTYTQAEAS